MQLKILYPHGMELILATANPHKKEELQGILQNHKILTPDELGIDFSYEETGHTYLENSLGKARHLYSIVKRPVIADDSGLSVVALDGAPGIKSARFGAENATENLSSPQRNALLLSKMEGITDRQAFFVCCMSAVLEPYRVCTVQETLTGEITLSPHGEGGFGYDPVFYIPDFKCTLAEISAEKKNALSHRGKAASKLATLLEGEKNEHRKNY